MQNIFALKVSFVDVDRFPFSPVLDADETSKNRTTIETQMGGILGVTSKNEKRHKMLFSVVKDELMQSIDRRKTKGKEWKDQSKKMQNVSSILNATRLLPYIFSIAPKLTVFHCLLLVNTCEKNAKIG